MKTIGSIIGLLIYAIIVTPIWTIWITAQNESALFNIMCFITLIICIYPGAVAQNRFYEWYKNHLK